MHSVREIDQETQKEPDDEVNPYFERQFQHEHKVEPRCEYWQNWDSPHLESEI